MADVIEEQGVEVYDPETQVEARAPIAPAPSFDYAKPMSREDFWMTRIGPGRAWISNTEAVALERAYQQHIQDIRTANMDLFKVQTDRNYKSELLKLAKEKHGPEMEKRRADARKAVAQAEEAIAKSRDAIKKYENPQMTIMEVDRALGALRNIPENAGPEVEKRIADIQAHALKYLGEAFGKLGMPIIPPTGGQGAGPAPGQGGVPMPAGPPAAAQPAIPAAPTQATLPTHVDRTGAVWQQLPDGRWQRVK